jgi:ferredoxin-type protein NapH
MSTVKQALLNLIPLGIGIAIAALLYYWSGWLGFVLIFVWIGGWISVGQFVGAGRVGAAKDIGRRISIFMASLVLLVFLGLFQRENLQLEELVFYLAAGFITRVVIHYAIAKILGPLIWGRGFCGWACWTAAWLELLPIKENRQIPQKYTRLRVPMLIISLALPIAFILAGYDYRGLHVTGGEYAFYDLVIISGKLDQLIFFLIGNGLYYVLAIALAFIFRKKRAFCKILCPVSLVMKVPARFARIRIKPSGEECTECGECNAHCPMDVDVMSYIRQSKPVISTECILCGQCGNVCPAGAIK